MDAGIDAIGFYVPQCVLNLRDLAQARSIPYAKLAQGLGQERMAIAPLGEDIVTMGAHAAHEALEHVDRQSIDTIIVATESGVDQSKSAAIYLHRLLELPKSCKAFEIKQACVVKAGWLPALILGIHGVALLYLDVYAGGPDADRRPASSFDGWNAGRGLD
ncbi:MAG: hypothetical protein OSB41_00075 [Kiritimatiellae bacterium]|nr:hypothetical protein [Kiritimatiellia bacterium]